MATGETLPSLDDSEVQFKLIQATDAATAEGPDVIVAEVATPDEERDFQKEIDEKAVEIAKLKAELVGQAREVRELREAIIFLSNNKVVESKNTESTPTDFLTVTAHARNPMQRLTFEDNVSPVGPINYASPAPNAKDNSDGLENSNQANCSCRHNSSPTNVVLQMPEGWAGYDVSTELAPFQLLEGDVFGIERFITEFRALYDQYKWPEAKARSILEKRITGKAKAMYVAGLGSQNFISLEERLQDLRTMFSLQMDRSQTKKLFNACKQEIGETPFSFRCRFLGLAEALRPPPGSSLTDYNKMVVERYKIGLFPNLAEELIRKGDMTMKESYMYIEDLALKFKRLKERSEKIVSAVTVETTVEPTISEQLRELKLVVETLMKQNKDRIEKENVRATLYCNFCKIRGHLERDCFKKQKPNSNVNNTSSNPRALN